MSGLAAVDTNTPRTTDSGNAGELEQGADVTFSGGFVRAKTSASSDAAVSLRVVEREHDMVRVRQKLMEVGVPYAFMLEGVPVVAIKRSTGKVDFYYIPPEE